MAVAGVVILYHPDDTVVQNVRSYLPYLDKLYVADNTEESVSLSSRLLQADNKVQLLWNGKNEGIAKRLNEAADLAMADGCNWLLTMDQDSIFQENNMQDYLLCAGSFLYKNRVAMFGVEFEKKTAFAECHGEETDHLITSGSIVNLNLYAEIGAFDEALFIDEVDLEYCYRAIIKGYKIIRFNNIFLLHHLGKIGYHKSLKNLAVTPRILHSPIRLYYMVRNYLYVADKYKNKFAASDAYRREALLNRIKNNLLYGKERFKTIQYIAKAIADYRKKKMGKIFSGN